MFISILIQGPPFFQSWRFIPIGWPLTSGPIISFSVCVLYLLLWDKTEVHWSVLEDTVGNVKLLKLLLEVAGCWLQKGKEAYAYDGVGIDDDAGAVGCFIREALPLPRKWCRRSQHQRQLFWFNQETVMIRIMTNISMVMVRAKFQNLYS